MTKLKPVLVWGKDYKALVSACKAGGYALPTVNVTGMNSLQASDRPRERRTLQKAL
ncbi:hypothetical protein [Nisaea sp.]|uniref:hypothetical protein n=1 Tax=Nisaea sp. TaxID=2024842 RepID=UPI00329974C6